MEIVNKFIFARNCVTSEMISLTRMRMSEERFLGREPKGRKEEGRKRGRTEALIKGYEKPGAAYLT